MKLSSSLRCQFGKIGDFPCKLSVRFAVSMALPVGFGVVGGL